MLRTATIVEDWKQILASTVCSRMHQRSRSTGWKWNAFWWTKDTAVYAAARYRSCCHTGLRQEACKCYTLLALNSNSWAASVLSAPICTRTLTQVSNHLDSLNCFSVLCRRFHKDMLMVSNMPFIADALTNWEGWTWKQIRMKWRWKWQLKTTKKLYLHEVFCVFWPLPVS